MTTLSRSRRTSLETPSNGYLASPHDLDEGVKHSFAQMSNASCVTLPSNASVFSQHEPTHHRHRANSDVNSSMAFSSDALDPLNPTSTALPSSLTPAALAARRCGVAVNRLDDLEPTELVSLKPFTPFLQGQLPPPSCRDNIYDDDDDEDRGAGTPTNDPNVDRAASRQAASSRGCRGGSSRSEDALNRVQVISPHMTAVGTLATTAGTVKEASIEKRKALLCAEAERRRVARTHHAALYPASGYMAVPDVFAHHHRSGEDNNGAWKTIALTIVATAASAAYFTLRHHS